MPPVPLWIAGRAANDRFYRRLFGSLLPGHYRHLRVGANGGPALAFYRPASPGAPHTLAAIQLVTTRDGAVVGIDHFMMRCHWPGLDFEKALSSITRLGAIFG